VDCMDAPPGGRKHSVVPTSYQNMLSQSEMHSPSLPPMVIGYNLRPYWILHVLTAF